jgi:hypothetical protein
MDRSDVKELYFITLISNVRSIINHGILPHNKSIQIPHDDSIAMLEMQEKRKIKKIPGTNKKLHDYANLYFDAHNPMLSRRRDRNNETCVLRIDANVLDLQGVIIADQNASSEYVRFYPVTQGLAAIDKNRLFAKYWTHPENLYEEWAHKSIKCAEVLVPHKVDSRYILGALVANQAALAAFKKLKIRLTVSIKSDIFF